MITESQLTELAEEYAKRTDKYLFAEYTRDAMPEFQQLTVSAFELALESVAATIKQLPPEVAASFRAKKER